MRGGVKRAGARGQDGGAGQEGREWNAQECASGTGLCIQRFRDGGGGLGATGRRASESLNDGEAVPLEFTSAYTLVRPPQTPPNP